MLQSIARWKELCALRSYFGPPMRPKNKTSFHQILLLILLEQTPKCKCLVLILLVTITIVTKIAAKNKLWKLSTLKLGLQRGLTGKTCNDG